MAAAVQTPIAPPIFGGTVKEYLPEGLAQNGGRISTDKVGFLRPTSASLPVDEMRERLKADGYLFVKGVIPREDVLDAREQ
jgi:phytanoyl-CoA hydroxylase